MKRTAFSATAAVSLLVLLSTIALAGSVRLKLATTTSTADTGLLDAVLPPFEKMTGLRVDVIPVGTGRALKLAENGDVDVVLVHNREAEDAFVEKGYGVNRRDVMYNDFAIVGPPEDPAGINGKRSAAEALAAIALARAPFVSRGDDSGTHMREKALWRAAGLSPAGPWYMEAGQGMGATLIIAGEKKAYCLADRATVTSFRDRTGLVILVEGDPALLNRYGIIAVSPARHPRANYMGAMSVIAWLTSPDGQRMIGEFRKEGAVLFRPDAYSAASM